jgi:hypothetical protein
MSTKQKNLQAVRIIEIWCYAVMKADSFGNKILSALADKDKLRLIA